MKPLLIIKTGSTLLSLRSRFGDFDGFILHHLPDIGDYLVAPIVERQWLPHYADIGGVVITGSHAMVTDREPWSEFVADWLRGIPVGTLPILGICYGHQLLAAALGGIVGYHPQGTEIGTVEIELTAAGAQDPLLGSLPPLFAGHVTHAQTVLKLPPGATVLARNDFESHHAFVIHGNLWGVQFHPEFNAEIEQTYIKAQEQEITQAGRNLSRIEESVWDHPYGRQLLQRFGELIRQ